MTDAAPSRDFTHRLARHLACPETGEPLAYADGALRSPSGHSYPVVRGIPRFVPDDAYVRSFSFEWNRHDKTQLDSAINAPVSANVLSEKTALTADDLRGKLVLDAGVGTGRFTEVMLAAGADVIGVDLSLAVEAAQRNVGGPERALVAQADIGRLPFAPGTFDVIVSIGVLHHTPDTRRYFEALVPLLRPGGSIAIWVYPNEGEYALRNPWIPWVNKLPSTWYYEWCRWFVPLMKRREGSRLQHMVTRFFPYSRQAHGIENDILDTFDAFSPRYHGIHSPDEVMGWFRDAGLVDVREPGPFRTSVRGRRPPE